MATLPLTEPVALEVPALPRAALDELYHFLLEGMSLTVRVIKLGHRRDIYEE